MVYATCTYSPEENEEVIDYLLRHYSNASVVSLTPPFENFSKGILEWEKKVFSQSVKNCLRIFPKKGFSGFFLAKIKKL
jgi:16S rRNA C967 or C1407 C5-methylase (RsmB/RsmF family)